MDRGVTMFDLLILSGVLGSFLFFLPGRLDGDEFFSLYFLALIAICSFCVSRCREIRFPALGAFLALAVLSLAFNLHAPHKWVMLNLFTAGMAIFVIAERTNLRMDVIGLVLALFFLAHNIVLLLQHNGVLFHGTELSGTFVMPWVMGCVACLAIPFVKSFNRDLCLFLVPSILLSHSTICVLVAILLFLQPKRCNWKVIGLATIALLSYILIFDRNIDSVRFTTVMNTLPHIKNWIIGNGIGSFGHSAFIHFNGVTPELWKWAHVEAYQVLFEMGILGFAALCVVVKGLWVRCHGSLRYAFLGVLMLSLFHPIAHFPRISVFIVLIVALILKGESNGDIEGIVL